MSRIIHLLLMPFTAMGGGIFAVGVADLYGVASTDVFLFGTGVSALCHAAVFITRLTRA